jgi:hypothetical protein
MVLISSLSNLSLFPLVYPEFISHVWFGFGRVHPHVSISRKRLASIQIIDLGPPKPEIGNMMRTTHMSFTTSNGVFL